jgi:hypothetical protein|tara:strand:- start:272 stop:421 length:150 start_codon:yes stop_codon:yes gene_type:complete
MKFWSKIQNESYLANKNLKDPLTFKHKVIPNAEQMYLDLSKTLVAICPT